MAEGAAIFVDTSIQIARTVHGRAAKAAIEKRLARPAFSVTGEVVKQEFKRRLLGEAKYLLNLLARYGNVQDVEDHVQHVLPSNVDNLRRKRDICLATLKTIYHDEGEPDLTDRAKSYLRTLLKYGLDRFDHGGDRPGGVDSIVREAGCACAQLRVIEQKPYEKYDLGKDQCTKMGSGCRVGEFLAKRRDLAAQILRDLKALPEAQKTAELRRAEGYLDRYLASPERAAEGNPCLKVGDLLIALESAGVPAFYTMNYRESQILCRSVGQDLIYKPPNFTRGEIECRADEPDWHAKLDPTAG